MLGQPQHTPAEDANTSAYSPAAPIQICLIAGLLGYATSLPALGLVQRIYLLAAVLLATVATQELFRFFHTNSRFAKQWMFFWFPFLYLIAINTYTNVYTHVPPFSPVEQ